MTNYVPNEKQVISKIIDDEAIIIKLEQGVYYSLNELGSLIWKMIVGKNTSSSIVDYIVANYSVGMSQAEKDVKIFLDKIYEEQLIIPSDESVASSVEPKSDKLPYVSPEIEAYRDMQDLLALDPPVPGMNDVTWKE